MSALSRPRGPLRPQARYEEKRQRKETNGRVAREGKARPQAGGVQTFDVIISGNNYSTSGRERERQNHDMGVFCRREPAVNPDIPVPS